MLNGGPDPGSAAGTVFKVKTRVSAYRIYCFQIGGHFQGSSVWKRGSNSDNIRKIKKKWVVIFWIFLMLIVGPEPPAGPGQPPDTAWRPKIIENPHN